MGRPLLPLDAEQVYKLARLGCTLEEIADILGCNRQTITNRFSQEVANARATLKSSLRRAQLKRAIRDRSDSMLIHLGKNMLGQGDKSGPPEALDEQPPKDDAGNAIEP